MLADQFVNLTKSQLSAMPGIGAEYASYAWPGYEVIGTRIRRANKFSLDDDVMLAADAVRSGRPSSIDAAIDFARLPFANTWIEWSRPEGSNDKLREGAYHTGRIGLLIECPSQDNLATGVAHLLWSLKPPHTALRISEACAIFDFTRALIPAVRQWRASQYGDISWPTPDETLAAILAAFPHMKKYTKSPADVAALVGGQDDAALVISPYLFAHRLATIDGELAHKITQAAGGDWEGEVGFLKAVLILLNCKNGVTQSASEHRPKLDRARIKAGKLPLLEHRIVHLKLRGPERRVNGDGHHASPRAHLVRGHFKVRKTGVYFWSPFVRGDALRGIVHHRYEVQT